MKLSEKLVTAIKAFFFLYLTMTLLILVLYFVRDDSRPLTFEGQTLMENWTVTAPDGEVLQAGSSYRSNGKVNGTYAMTAVLPEEIREGSNFCIVVGDDASVYIDGELRNDFDASRDVLFPGGCVKRFYMLTPLTPEDSGKEITFYRTGTTRRGFIYQNSMVASATGLYSFLMDNYGLSFMLAEILFIFSLVLVIVSIAMRLSYKRQIEMFYGSMAILVISAWLITNSYLFPFIYGHNHIDGICNYLSCLLMPFNLTFYLDALQHGRYRKLMIGVSCLSILSCILWPVLHFTNTFSFPNALLYIDGILGLQVVIIIGLLIYDAVRGNAKDYAYTAIGFAGFLVCGFSEIVILNFIPIMQDDIPMLIGLAFLLTLSVIQQMHDLKAIREEGQRAVDISEAKTRFLASMSHEIRTPINAVLGMNEMILRENRDPVIGEYAQSVKSSGQMLLMLVNDVLDFSKIEAGKMEINDGEYRLSALLRSIMPMLKERADEKELRLQTVIISNVPDVQISDEFRLRQILINLTNNAIKYTDAGSVTIMVGGERTSADRFLLSLTVKDTGRGISEEGQAHLFEAFSRADLGKNENIEGTGLGLAIVKSIVDSMGGKISVTSKLKEGSEFCVKIPVWAYGSELLTEDFMEQKTVTTAGESGCDFTAPSAKILAVDDNPSNLKLVKLFLKRAGIVPDTCDSGTKAIEKCKETRYDLILLDHMMPDPDGIETLRIIRKNADSLNTNVPVIVLTANALAGSRQMYLDAGFADYLAKPIDAVLLEQTVKKYLPAKKILPALQGQADASASPAASRAAGSDLPVQEAAAKKRERPGPGASLEERLTFVEGLDYATALRYVGGQQDLLADVVQAVAEGCAENIANMRAALSADDLEEYGRLAHSIKGQMATIGHASFSERAKKHEYATKEGNRAFIDEDCEAFFAKYREICELISGQ